MHGIRWRQGGNKRGDGNSVEVITTFIWSENRVFGWPVEIHKLFFPQMVHIAVFLSEQPVLVLVSLTLSTNLSSNPRLQEEVLVARIQVWKTQKADSAQFNWYKVDIIFQFRV